LNRASSRVKTRLFDYLKTKKEESEEEEEPAQKKTLQPPANINRLKELS